MLTAAGLVAISIAALCSVGCGSKDRRTARTPATAETGKKTSTAGSGLVVVPGVVGRDQAVALRVLSEQGLEPVISSSRDDCDREPGVVVGQTPPARTQAAAGSEVQLVLATRSGVTAPVSGTGFETLAPGDSRRQEVTGGEEVGIAYGISGDSCTTGLVTVSHPLAGSEQYLVPAGEMETLTLSPGPGEITVSFVSTDLNARLALRID
jgi:hypothetical protein